MEGRKRKKEEGRERKGRKEYDVKDWIDWGGRGIRRGEERGSRRVKGRKRKKLWKSGEIGGKRKKGEGRERKGRKEYDVKDNLEGEGVRDKNPIHHENPPLSHSAGGVL